jgi:uncharacterized membrane protein YhaH (DUF805 family)
MTAGTWFSVHGRIGRRRCWLAYMMPATGGGVLLYLVCGVAAGLLAEHSAPAPNSSAPLALLAGLISLVVLWPLLVGSIKRLHDRDRSGWWIGLQHLLVALLILLVWQVQLRGQLHEPLVMATLLGAATGVALLSLWLFVELYVLRGTLGPNRFGADPNGPAIPVWRQSAPQPSALPTPLPPTHQQATRRATAGRRG